MSEGRAPISVCLLVCNEADHLPRCLDSVSWADEIVVVVDEKSDDDSEAIARRRAHRVERRPYAGDVAQKGYCVDLARNDWVLIIDPDEVLPTRLAEEIQRVVSRGDCDGYELNRVTRHLGRWLLHGDFFPDWTLRLFRRSKSRFTGRDPHGRVEVEGRVERLGGAPEASLEHYSYRDLAEQVERIQFFSAQAAAALYAEGRRARVADWCLRPPARFLRAYVLKQGFRDGFPGFAVAVATAFHVFLKYAKLWEKERRAAE